MGYTKGIAFILEGASEKVFYHSFMKWLAIECRCDFVKVEDLDNGDVFYEWIIGEEKFIIKFNVVGTITQVAHSGKWFNNTCAKKYKIPWKVFLCYDTDSHEYNITKFYEGDWKLLREELKKAKAEEIIDLAAQADIEDIMLVDLYGICKYLEIVPPEKLIGRKGKAKMKFLYRSCGKTYHEGEKSTDMVEQLDFAKIMKESPIKLDKLAMELITHNIL